MPAWPALISVSQFVEGYLHQVGVGAREVAVGRGRGWGALPPGLLGEHGVHQGRAPVLSSALSRLRPVLLLVLGLVTLGHRGVAGHRPEQVRIFNFETFCYLVEIFEPKFKFSEFYGGRLHYYSREKLYLSTFLCVFL